MIRPVTTPATATTCDGCGKPEIDEDFSSGWEYFGDAEWTVTKCDECWEAA